MYFRLPWQLAQGKVQRQGESVLPPFVVRDFWTTGIDPAPDLYQYSSDEVYIRSNQDHNPNFPVHEVQKKHCFELSESIPKHMYDYSLGMIPFLFWKANPAGASKDHKFIETVGQMVEKHGSHVVTLDIHHRHAAIFIAHAKRIEHMALRASLNASIHALKWCPDEQFWGNQVRNVRKYYLPLVWMTLSFMYVMREVVKYVGIFEPEHGERLQDASIKDIVDDSILSDYKGQTRRACHTFVPSNSLERWAALSVRKAEH